MLIPLKHFSKFIVGLEKHPEKRSLISQEKILPDKQTSGWSIPSPHLTMPQTELIRKPSLLWAWFWSAVWRQASDATVRRDCWSSQSTFPREECMLRRSKQTEVCKNTVGDVFAHGLLQKKVRISFGEDANYMKVR